MKAALREVVVGDAWEPKGFTYLAMLMMALMLITNVLNLKFVDVYGLVTTASLVSFVLSLILGDIMTEVYGYKRVRKVLWVGLGCLVLYAIFIQAAVLLPPASTYGGNEAFSSVFAQAPRVVLASIAAYFVTELTNSQVMSRLKTRYRAKRFYLRALLSTAVAKALDGVVFFGVAFAGVLPLNVLVSAVTLSWVTVLVAEVIVLPLTLTLAQWIKNYEGVEYFDTAPK